LRPEQIGQMLAQVRVGAMYPRELHRFKKAMSKRAAVPVVTSNRVVFILVLPNGVHHHRELQQTQMARIQVASRTKDVILQVGDREHYSLTLASRAPTHTRDRLPYFEELLLRWLRGRCKF